VVAGFRAKRGDAVGGRRPARGVAAGAGSSLTGGRSALAACWNVPASMVFRASTKPTQVRARVKINTRTTRTNLLSGRSRHHFSHTWLERGGPEGDLMELNGWSFPQMLARYGASARSARARRTYDRIMTDT
jgi:hypothetical protein